MDFFEAPGRLTSFLEGRRAQGVPASDGDRDAPAGDRRGAAAAGAQAHHRRRIGHRPVDVLRAARRHDRGVQPRARPRCSGCCARRRPRSCSSPPHRANRSTRRSGCATRCRQTGLPFAGVVANRFHHDLADDGGPDLVASALPKTLGEHLAASVAANFADYCALAHRDAVNVERLAADMNGEPLLLGAPVRRRRPRHRRAAAGPQLPVRLRRRACPDDRRRGRVGAGACVPAVGAGAGGSRAWLRGRRVGVVRMPRAV